jgi:uncharacterized membrane protein YvbJ
MALINCPECTKEVSTSAISCPNCGAPIAAAKEAEAAGAPLTTTQLTSKKLKGQQAIAVLMVIVGTIWLFVAMGQQPASGAGLPLIITLVGLIWFIVTRVRTWWHHS